MNDGGKGDWIPGTNAKAFDANYPGIDWTARDRLALHTAIVHGLAALGLSDVAVSVRSVGGSEWEITCPGIDGFLIGGRTGPRRTLDDLAAAAVDAIARQPRIVGILKPRFYGGGDDFGVIAVEHREEPDFSLPKRAPWWRRAWERVVCFVLAPCWDP